MKVEKFKKRKLEIFIKMPSESVNANSQHFKNLAVVQLCEITRIRYMRYANSMTLKIIGSAQQRKRIRDPATQGIYEHTRCVKIYTIRF